MTEKISYIPSRIKNAAVGGHVAGADDIMDDELQLTQSQINSIVLGDAININLTASPSTVFVGEMKSITLNATISTPADSIKIKKGDTVISTGRGTSLSGTDSITPSIAGNVSYIAEFVLGGLTKTSSRSVTAVNKIYYGSGTIYTDATNSPSARTSPAGTYNVTVAVDATYIFFNVPATMTINKATLSGFNFPLESPENVTIDGVAYKSYRSSNTNDAGTYQIVIS
jgi:hypothetical protein